MRHLILSLALLVLAWGASGCFKADIEVPPIGAYGGPPPPKDVRPANPNDVEDLRRENAELRQRVNWLDDQNRRLAKKHQDLDGDLKEIRDDMAKIAAERDRYKKAAGY